MSFLDEVLPRHHEGPAGLPNHQAGLWTVGSRGGEAEGSKAQRALKAEPSERMMEESWELG